MIDSAHRFRFKYILIMFLISIAGLILLETSKAERAQAIDGKTFPGGKYVCDWVNSGHITCKWQNVAMNVQFPLIGGIAENFFENKKNFFYNPSLSQQAGHAVFETDNAKDPSIHVSSDGSSASLSSSLDGKNAEVTGVDLNNAENAQLPPAGGYCGIAMKPAGTTQVGTGNASTANVPNAGNISCKTANGNTYTGPQWSDAEKLLQSIDSGNNCEKNTGILGYVTCPILRMINDSIGKTIGACDTCKEDQGILVELLTVNPLGGDGQAALQGAWEKIKNIALALYVVVFLVAIFANSLSLSVDQYAIKRMMPRLVAGAILTQFSWLIVWAMISISNLIGAGVAVLIKEAAPGHSFSYSAGLGDAFGPAILGASGALYSGLGMILVIIVGLVVLISLIISILTFVARRLIIYILLLAAPIAFVAWILPNTEKLYKAWWSQLLKILAMFPIATGLISISLLLSQIFTREGSGVFNAIIGLAFPVIALIMLPKTFKWGGGMLAAISGFMAGKMSSGAKLAKKGAKAGGKVGYQKALANDRLGGAAALLGGGFTQKQRMMKQAKARNAETEKAEKLVKGASSLGGAAALSQLEDLVMKGNAYEKRAAITQLMKSGNKGVEKVMNYTRSDALRPIVASAAAGNPEAFEKNLHVKFAAGGGITETNVAGMSNDAFAVQSKESAEAFVHSGHFSKERAKEVLSSRSADKMKDETRSIYTQHAGLSPASLSSGTGSIRQAPQPHRVTPSTPAAPPPSMGPGGGHTSMPPPPPWANPPGGPPPGP